MIVIDSSALIAVLDQEPDADAFLLAIANADGPVLSAATLVEAAIVMMRRHGPQAAKKLAAFVREAGIQVEPVSPAQADLAIRAFARYGKGMRQGGALNLGDCFSYAASKDTALPLLYKGKDFSTTDVETALL